MNNPNIQKFKNAHKNNLQVKRKYKKKFKIICLNKRNEKANSSAKY